MYRSRSHLIGRLIAASAAVAVFAGCAGGSSDSAETTDPITDPAADTVSTDVVAITQPGEPSDTTVDSVPTTDANDDDDTTTTTVDAAPVDTDPPLIPAAEQMALLSEPADVGTQPELMWDVVDGAASYRLVVLDADGLPYWSWSGPETSVFLGGGSSSDGAGPAVGEGFTWTVTALDADGALLAASGIGSLSN